MALGPEFIALYLISSISYVIFQRFLEQIVNFSSGYLTLVIPSGIQADVAFALQTHTLCPQVFNLKVCGTLLCSVNIL
jgi:hypothetical protein